MTNDIIIIEGKEIKEADKITFKKDNLPKYWDKEYINQQIDLIKNHRHKLLMHFLWMTGVRITEAISLTKKDINFSNHTLNIRWLKNRKYLFRIIPMHPRLKDMLQIYTATLKVDDKVFNISRQRAWQIVKKNLKGNPHRFRHSFSVNWLRHDGDITILSRMLGHSSIITTMNYLKIVPVDQGKELNKINFE